MDIVEFAHDDAFMIEAWNVESMSCKQAKLVSVHVYFGKEIKKILVLL